MLNRGRILADHKTEEMGMSKMFNQWMKQGLFIFFIYIFGQQLFSVDFGLKLGLGLVNLNHSEDSVIQFSARPEFAGGVFLSFKILKNISLQPELYYLRKGSNTDNNL